MIRLLSFLLLFLFSSVSKAVQVKLIVQSADEEGIPFTSVHVTELHQSITTNANGEADLHLPAGDYHIRLTALGFLDSTYAVNIPHQGAYTLLLKMREDPAQLEEVVIMSDQRDRGKEIMRKVRDKRKQYLQAYDDFTCVTYHKVSTLKEDLTWFVPASDTITDDMLTKRERRLKRKTEKKTREREQDSLRSKYFRTVAPAQYKQVRFTEVFGKVYHRHPSAYKEVITGAHEVRAKAVSNGVSYSFGEDIGEHDIAPDRVEGEMGLVLLKTLYLQEFDLYENMIDAPSICAKPILSPLAPTAPLNYLYDLVGEHVVNGKKIYHIKVTSLFAPDALFFGSLFIEDGTWALLSADLQINKPALTSTRDFHLVLHYDRYKEGVYVPKSKKVTYMIKDGGNLYTTEHALEHIRYELEPEFPPKTFTNEIRRYEDQAYELDSSFWATHRPVELNKYEDRHLVMTDSLQKVYESKEYLHAMDSAYNKITIWKVLLMGIGHRDRYRRYDFMIEPLIMQLNPLGIGGYRHKLGGHFNYEFKNAQELDVDGKIDYGFKNSDVKGKLGLGWMYLPKKFMRTYIMAGDVYDMVNSYASLGTIISRSNYVRAQMFSIQQRMEIVNGLYGELTYEYSDQKPITDLVLDKWSGDLFGNNNTPVDFQRYIKSEVRFELKYKMFQKYQIRKNKKIVMASKYPVLNFIYRKGIPGLFNSEVNFDYFEFGIKDDAHAGRWGTSNWSVQTGAFTNRSNLRLLEYKYFRGSDALFFSDPVRSFQLLGPTLNTNNYFFRANYIHHFDGVILGKIPGINRMKLNLAGGASTLVIPDQNFRHAEVYAGIERVTRIKRGLFRFSVYAVTADNNLSKAAWTIKFGINFFNTYTNQWSY